MKKQIAFAAAALAAAMLVSGCGDTGRGSGGAAVSPESRELSDSFFLGGADSYAAWKDIDRNTVVASVDNAEYGDFFNITFGDFYSEYLYYLVSYKIDDDMSDMYREQCMSYRDSIITYLTFEKMYLYVAEHDYGITEDILTDEQKKEISDSAEQVKSDWASTFYDSVSSFLGDSATDSEIGEMCSEVLAATLEKCGLDTNVFYQWETNRYIEELVIDELSKSAEVTDEQVEEMYRQYREEAKQLAETSPGEYEQDPSYAMLYLPEDARIVRHIFLSYGDETEADINIALAEGDYEAVNELIDLAITDDIRDTVEDIQKGIADGMDFAELQELYSEDSAGEYMVLKESEYFPPECLDALYELENPGDVTDTVFSTDGIYIIQYKEDAKISDEDTQQVKSEMRSYLEYTAKTAAQGTAYNEWLERFPYTVDRELLKIEESSGIDSGISLEDLGIDDAAFTDNDASGDSEETEQEEEPEQPDDYIGGDADIGEDDIGNDDDIEIDGAVEADAEIEGADIEYDEIDESELEAGDAEEAQSTTE